MSDEKQKHYPWMEGMPTRPDVDALMQAFPPDKLKVGRRISDTEIRAVIGIGALIRFRTICSGWRKRLHKDHSVILYREKEQGFFVPSNEQIFAEAHPRLTHANRTYKKHMREIAIVKPENATEQLLQDHQGKLMHALSRETKKARMNLLPQTAAPETPRIEPPKASK